jgi:GTP-binding protein EngB required for normal cell division
LVPKHVIICGIDKKSQMERSWFLSKLDKVVIQALAKVAEAPEVVVEKVFKKEQEKWEKPAHKKGDEKVETVKVVTEKEVVQVPEQKKPGVGEAAKRLWDAVVDVTTELVKTIKGWI